LHRNIQAGSQQGWKYAWMDREGSWDLTEIQKGHLKNEQQKWIRKIEITGGVGKVMYKKSGRIDGRK